jgi:hypothetical protein
MPFFLLLGSFIIVSSPPTVIASRLDNELVAPLAIYEDHYGVSGKLEVETRIPVCRDPTRSYLKATRNQQVLQGGRQVTLYSRYWPLCEEGRGSGAGT